VVIPIARTNLVTNPSFELATTGWSSTAGGGIARTSNGTYYGVFGLEVVPTATNEGVYYTMTLDADGIYAVSMKFRSYVPGQPFDLSVRTTGGVTLSNYHFVSTGRWQWILLIYNELTGASRRISITSA